MKKNIDVLKFMDLAFKAAIVVILIFVLMEFKIMNNTEVLNENGVKILEPPIAIEDMPDTVNFGYDIILVSPIKDLVYERIKYFQYREDILIKIKKNMYEYSYIPFIIKNNGLSLNHAFILQNESQFDPTAVSRAGATGIAQLASRTARYYDMKVNWYIDDRKEPIRATRVFDKHYLDLKKKYKGDPPLALSGYNRGETRMNRLIRYSKIHDYYRLNGNGMPWETKNYVANIVALYLISKTQYYKDLKVVYQREPIPWIEVEIHPKNYIHLSEIYELIQDDTFMRLNLQFIKYTIPPQKQVIVVPAKHQEVLAKFFKSKESPFSLLLKP